MNNFLFGNSRIAYYETICGGSGASFCLHEMQGYKGVDAVQCHMTNTRITDPEVFEME